MIQGVRSLRGAACHGGLGRLEITTIIVVAKLEITSVIRIRIQIIFTDPKRLQKLSSKANKTLVPRHDDVLQGLQRF